MVQDGKGAKMAQIETGKRWNGYEGSSNFRAKIQLIGDGDSYRCMLYLASWSPKKISGMMGAGRFVFSSSSLFIFALYFLSLSLSVPNDSKVRHQIDNIELSKCTIVNWSCGWKKKTKKSKLKYFITHQLN